MSFIGLFLIRSLDVSHISTERKGLVKQVYECVFWGAAEEPQNTMGHIYLPKYNDTLESISSNWTEYILENPPKIFFGFIFSKYHVTRQFKVILPNKQPLLLINGRPFITLTSSYKAKSNQGMFEQTLISNTVTSYGVLEDKLVEESTWYIEF